MICVHIVLMSQHVLVLNKQISLYTSEMPSSLITDNVSPIKSLRFEFAIKFGMSGHGILSIFYILFAPAARIYYKVCT